MLKFYSGKLVSEWDALQAASVMQVEHGYIIEGAKYGAKSALYRHRGQPSLTAPLPHHPACGSAPGGSRS